MASAEEEFLDRLRATFKVEAEEHLQAISSTLLELEKSPSAMPATGAVESVYREAHSLKGAARAVDFSEIETICQAIEGVFAGWKKELSCPSPESLDALHGALDTIHALLEKSDGGSGKNAPAPSDELVHRLSRFQAGRPPIELAEMAAIEPEQSPAVDSGQGGDWNAAKQENKGERVAPLVDATVKHDEGNLAVDSEKIAAAQTVRIPIEKLESRLLQAEDMLTVKAMVSQRAGDLREASGCFQAWQKEWAKVSIDARVLRQSLEHQTDSAARKTSFAVANGLVNFLDWNFDYLRSLERKLMSLTAQAEQDRHVVGRRVDDLLEDSKRLLMLPFSTMSRIFPKLVRDLCRDQAKEAEVEIQGGEVEIDKRILERMNDAMIHILRNCVDHGVESPDQRQRLGKPARAVISISVRTIDGNKVEILVADDGAGVDLQGVKDSAVRHGIISAAESRAISDARAMELVFHSEVSSSPTVTKISGRGLGMAIVRAQTEKLGGRVSIESAPQKGTSIRMVLPLTLATFRGVLVGIGDRVFVIPTVNVDRVGRVKPEAIGSVENRQTLTFQGKAVSLARLDTVLGLHAEPIVDRDVESYPIVLLHSGDERMAFVVDQVLREEEVLVKPPPRPLVRVRNISGIIVLGSGKTAPLLNVSDLIQSARLQGAQAVTAISPGEETKAPVKRVLVAEDSITSRMLLKGILEGAGYVVRTAVDGMDAFTMLREDRFDLVVSDVEMPRLNGFDLTCRIRADKRLGNLPVVLVSALESREERERGMDAGASAYLIKSSFDQSDLLETVHRLV